MVAEKEGEKRVALLKPTTASLTKKKHKELTENMGMRTKSKGTIGGSDVRATVITRHTNATKFATENTSTEVEKTRKRKKLEVSRKDVFTHRVPIRGKKCLRKKHRCNIVTEKPGIGREEGGKWFGGGGGETSGTRVHLPETLHLAMGQGKGGKKG